MIYEHAEELAVRMADIQFVLENRSIPPEMNSVDEQKIDNFRLACIAKYMNDICDDLRQSGIESVSVQELIDATEIMTTVLKQRERDS